MTVTIAGSLDDALAALSTGARPIAGGSDLVVAARHGSTELPQSLVAIDRITDLQGIDVLDTGVSVGACVTHAELMSHPAVVGSYTALADAAALVGSPGTRNVGTVGGNVMNASPAMDTGAPLLVLGASCELRSEGGTRRVGLDELWSGPGSTTAAHDELCVALHLPAPAAATGSAYLRLEFRRAMEIAVVGAAAAVSLADDGTIASARVALSAVAPTVVEVSGLDVAGLAVDEAARVAADAARETSAPISDLRATDRYRRHTVGVIAGRALGAAVRRAQGETIAVPVNRAEGIGASR